MSEIRKMGDLARSMSIFQWITCFRDLRTKTKTFRYCGDRILFCKEMERGVCF